MQQPSELHRRNEAADLALYCTVGFDLEYTIPQTFWGSVLVSEAITLQ